MSAAHYEREDGTQVRFIDDCLFEIEPTVRTLSRCDQWRSETSTITPSPTPASLAARFLPPRACDQDRKALDGSVFP